MNERRIRFALTSAMVVVAAYGATNRVTLSSTGRGADKRPFSISRVFARGEIKQFALASIDGNALFSQCDVMTRWDDGSLQHAIVSFQADIPAGNTKLNVDFIDSPAKCSLNDNDACDAAALTGEAMAGFNDGNWGASINTEINGISHRADAREMLAAGALRYWLRGPVVTQAIIEDRSPDLNFDWGYRDQTIVVLAGALSPTATTLSLSDTSAVQVGATIRVDSEELQVCARNDRSVTIGIPNTCPSIAGRAQNGTRAAVHQQGAVGRILADANAGDNAGWTNRVIAYTPFNFQRGLAANATTMPVYSTDLLQSLPLPFTIQIGLEQISVCKLAPGQPGTLSFGSSLDKCPNIDGRGINGTKAQAHPDNAPISSPNWRSSWVDAPSNRFKSLHPIFVATFYKDWAGVKIEYILENVWVEKQQDQQYGLTLYSGPNSSQKRLAQTVHHRALTRWRKVFWDGTEPPAVNIDLNFDYLIQSKVVPNFDRSYSVPQNMVVADVNRAKAAGMGDINATGVVYPAMPVAGGRADLGLFTAWDVRYLYTFDSRLLDVVLDAGNVSGYIPVHFRESDPARTFDSGRSVPAFGKPLSADARPAFVSHWLDFGPEAVNPVGLTSHYPGRNLARRLDNWNVDIAHQPNLVFVPYLITGDWYYLEELQFWATRNLLESTNGNCPYCRHDDWAFISESNAETRGLAWGLRSVGHAAYFSPDGTPEKSYFIEKLENNIAIREGVMNVTNGTYFDPDPNSMWSWGRNTAAEGVRNPMKFPHRALGTAASPPPSSGGKACTAESVWMYNLNHITWGHLEELGFTVISGLRREAARNLLQQILDPQYPKELLAAAYIPTRGLSTNCVDPPPFASWADIAANVADTEQVGAMTRWKQGAADPEFGYPPIAMAAASFLSGIVDDLGSGDDAWNWVKSNVVNQNAFNNNPKWALLPRAQGPAPAIVPKRRPVGVAGKKTKKKAQAGSIIAESGF